MAREWLRANRVARRNFRPLEVNLSESNLSLMGGTSKVKCIVPMLTTLFIVLNSCLAYCEQNISYQNTVDLIKKTMTSSTSVARQESYGYIRLENCIMDYNVSGTYPVGDTYNINYSSLNFSGLNQHLSKAGHDYTSFITLNFDKQIESKSNNEILNIHTVVVNVSNDAKAAILFNLISKNLHL